MQKLEFRNRSFNPNGVDQELIAIYIWELVLHPPPFDSKSLIEAH